MIIIIISKMHQTTNLIKRIEVMTKWAVKQNGFLRYTGEMTSQFMQPDSGYIDSVNEDTTFGSLNQSEQAQYQCWFTSAGSTDNGDLQRKRIKFGSQPFIASSTTICKILSVISSDIFVGKKKYTFSPGWITAEMSLTARASSSR